MSPQRSNRTNLLEGALRCLERLPPEAVTARAIAEESGANLASIAYHFGSKDVLVSEAAVLGLDRWLADLVRRLDSLGDAPGAAQRPAQRLMLAADAVEAGRRDHLGLVRNYLSALAKAPYDDAMRERLARGFAESRPAVAAALGLGDDESGADAAGLVLALFHGLLVQVSLDPGLAIDGDRLERALARLAASLPRESVRSAVGEGR